MRYRPPWTARMLGVAVLSVGFTTSCSEGDPGAGAGDIAAIPSRVTVEAACIDAVEELPDGAWLCPANRDVECLSGAFGGTVETIFVKPEDASCNSVTLVVPEGPHGPGDHPIDVVIANNAGTMECSAILRVVDTREPMTITRDVELWPPNHAMRRVSIDDCVTAMDACDGLASTRFLWAKSDEPDDAIGDGEHTGDITFPSVDVVELRAERQGGGDGRVYTLGWRAEDRAGHAVTGTCHVRVPHDQGAGAGPGESHYEVAAPPEASRPRTD